jgi:3-phosphoshikimate 1-carboxyvinyltransferase
MTRLISRAAAPLTGRIRVPGDKSISHRALILAGLAIGKSRICGLLEGEDVLRTAAAMRALGAEITRCADGMWSVDGVGTGKLAEPDDVLDLGNSGTGVRLLMGLVAARPVTAFFTGDASLRRRPMARVAEPLAGIGARIVARKSGRLPLAVIGTSSPAPIAYRLPVPSAQVKSAVLLAGLGAPGETTVIEPLPTRDHSERMLRHFGAMITVEREADGRRITLVGRPDLRATDLVVPGDPSSAAFAMVAALLIPDSRVAIENVGINPLRTGLLDTLREMGADISVSRERDECGEPVADLMVRASALRGIEVPAARAPRMIDEYPVLAVAAARAQGRTVMHGLGELRVKESDRLSAMASGLAACGAKVSVDGDTLCVEGRNEPLPGGATIATQLDHRIAMAFLVLGMAAEAPVGIDDGGTINTSFPGFVELMNGLGAKIKHL